MTGYQEQDYFCASCKKGRWRESLPVSVALPESVACPFCGAKMQKASAEQWESSECYRAGDKGIVFVRTRYVYESYTDYWSLVELAKFPTCYVDEVDISLNVAYILSPMNGEWKPHIDHCRKSGYQKNCLLVQWNLERPEGSGGLQGYNRANEELLSQRYFDEIWVSDRALANTAKLRYATLGSDSRLGAPGHHDEWDVIHLSCPSHKRSWIWTRLAEAGLAVAPNGWGPERHDRLRGSKFMLNIHKSDDGNYLEPLRLSLAAAYALPVISEKLVDPYPYKGVESVRYEQLVPRLVEALQEDYGMWREKGRVLWETMTGQFGFRRQVEAMFL